MNEKLNVRLKKCDIEISDILLSLEGLNKEDSVIVYTSHMEDLGTDKSDFDVYVIYEEDKELSWYRSDGSAKIQNVIINNVLFDIEYWAADVVEDIIEDCNDEKFLNLSVDFLKLIQRLSIGEKVSNNKLTNRLLEKLSKSRYKEQIVKMYTVFSNSAIEDSVCLLEYKELFGALKCARFALDNAVAALNAKEGFPNLKPKWIPKILINNYEYHKEIAKEYMKLQIYSSINENNLEEHVESLLELSQKILSKIAIDN